MASPKGRPKGRPEGASPGVAPAVTDSYFGSFPKNLIWETYLGIRREFSGNFEPRLRLREPSCAHSLQGQAQAKASVPLDDLSRSDKEPSNTIRPVSPGRQPATPRGDSDFESPATYRNGRRVSSIRRFLLPLQDLRSDRENLDRTALRLDLLPRGPRNTVHAQLQPLGEFPH